jgi:hypothetical protein
MKPGKGATHGLGLSIALLEGRNGWLAEGAGPHQPAEVCGLMWNPAAQESRTILGCCSSSQKTCSRSGLQTVASSA